MLQEEKNPWTTLSQTTQYENPWIKVREDQIINPVGNSGIYGVVSFKNLAIGVLPIDKEGNTYLVGQYRYPLDEYSWEIPEGGCLIGKEKPLEAAQRELLEETGLIAQEWTELLKIHCSNSVTDETGYIFLAQNLSQGQAAPEETEELKVKKVSFEQALKMVLGGEISDALSIMAILHWEVLRKQ